MNRADRLREIQRMRALIAVGLIMAPMFRVLPPRPAASLLAAMLGMAPVVFFLDLWALWALTAVSAASVAWRIRPLGSHRSWEAFFQAFFSRYQPIDQAAFQRLTALGDSATINQFGAWLASEQRAVEQS